MELADDRAGLDRTTQNTQTNKEKEEDLKYDPDGNRIFKDSSETGQRKYIVDIAGRFPVILMELDSADNMDIMKKYIYAHGQILAQHDIDDDATPVPKDDIYFYLHDRLGSVRQVIDTSADVVKYYTYEPFGETLEHGGAFDNPFRFTGQYFDSEISQYYLRARQYDPHIYLFTARDPIFGDFEEPLTLHPYLYCMNDPVNYIDPQGEFLFTFAGAFVGSILRDSMRNHAYALAARAGAIAIGLVIDLICYHQTYKWARALLTSESEKSRHTMPRNREAIDKWINEDNPDPEPRGTNNPDG